jgi:AbiJ N-terminal domain 4
MRFSQRQGLEPVQKLAQRESIDAELRNSLWSVLTLMHWDRFVGPRDSYDDSTQKVRGSTLGALMVQIWLHFFKEPVDTVEEYWPNCLHKLRQYFFAAQWNQVYDFIEFVNQNGSDGGDEVFAKTCNVFLERENAAYRFVNGVIGEVTSGEEIDEIEAAIKAASPFFGVKQHLSASLRLMSDKTSPDFRNSIKESISAVESLAKQLSDDKSGTLGSVLNKLEKTKKLHPALKNAFSSLYGYTNDAEGIRHALLEESNLSKADARFMLICCSAFVNFTIDAIATR